MPLLPTSLYLATNPVDQVSDNFQKLSKTPQLGPPWKQHSYNELLNSGNAYPEGMQRWQIVSDSINKVIHGKAYTCHSNVYMAFEIDDGSKRMGIVGGVPGSYLSSHVYKHEATEPKRVKKFVRYLNTVKCQAEPTVLAFRHTKDWDALKIHVYSDPPTLAFNRYNNKYRIWVLPANSPLGKRIQVFFSTLNSLVVVDGHHRKAAIEELSLTGSPSLSLLSYCLPDSDIQADSFFWHAAILPDSLLQWVNQTATARVGIPQKNTKHKIVQIKIKDRWFMFPNSDRRSVLCQIDHLFGKHNIPLHRTPQKDRTPFFPKEKKNLTFLVEYSPFEFKQIMNWAEQRIWLPAKSSYLTPKVPLGLFLHTV